MSKYIQENWIDIYKLMPLPKRRNRTCHAIAHFQTGQAGLYVRRIIKSSLIGATFGSPIVAFEASDEKLAATSYTSGTFTTLSACNDLNK